MLRFYNTRLKIPQTGAGPMYEKLRRLFIQEQAVRFGLQRRLLWNIPDANEAFDGDLAQICQLISQLVACGLADFRLSGSDEQEVRDLLDFYGPERRFTAVVITPKVFRAQEAQDQAAEVCLPPDVPSLIF